METNNLQEALQRIDAERTVVAVQLRTATARLKMLDSIREDLIVMIGDTSGRGHHETFSIPETGSDVTDIIGHVAEILYLAGKPMHVTEIAPPLSLKMGREMRREAFEPGLNRHIARVKKRRIDKFGPSRFGLPEWKSPKLQPATQDRLSLVS